MEWKRQRMRKRKIERIIQSDCKTHSKTCAYNREYNSHNFAVFINFHRRQHLHRLLTLSLLLCIPYARRKNGERAREREKKPSTNTLEILKHIHIQAKLFTTYLPNIRNIREWMGSRCFAVCVQCSVAALLLLAMRDEDVVLILFPRFSSLTRQQETITRFELLHFSLDSLENLEIQRLNATQNR